ncbi:carboxymuconolactone decarboxylase family protein [Luteimonas aquatica]|uniref:carboxymuconolactone decarboxylase family protein n=1 Tax=Luteimonas aquatica TaxID=450364 RepID=UPI001F567787|nr:carboxymuconolactone decarboxylase family protein [Luteimonas aquatica]
MSDTQTIRYYQQIPDVLSYFAAVHPLIESHGLDRTLRDLVHLRASQINGCAFCIRMHTREARQNGESNERLDRLVGWRHMSDYSERERAALAWTEALTLLEREADYAAMRAALRRHFSDQEIAALTAEVAMINLWNRMQISCH